jgi:hypothetical protein
LGNTDVARFGSFMLDHGMHRFAAVPGSVATNRREGWFWGWVGLFFFYGGYGLGAFDLFGPLTPALA